MHRVVLGMDERVLDVGDSFSQLHAHVEIWLLNNVGAKDQAWFPAYDSGVDYCLLFVTESDALKFKLSWL